MTTTITDWSDLDDVRNNLTEDYRLEADLTPSTAGYSGIGDSFTPIDGFSGEFDGNAHRIEGLFVDTGSSENALFNQINDSGHVHDLAVLDFAYNSVESQVAPLAVSNKGLIEDCITSGSFDTSLGGGFVHANEQEGVIRRCIANCDLKGSAPDTGLFVAGNNGLIEDSYAISFGDFLDYGFVGNLGFFGAGDEINCFWDIERSGDVEQNGDATPLTTDEMQGRDPIEEMAGLDFVDEWSVVAGDANADSDGYPILRTLPIDLQDEYQAATPTAYIDLIANLSASVEEESPPTALSWENNSGPPSVGIYRTTDTSAAFPADYSLIDTLSPASDTYADDSIVDAGSYRYRVGALDDSDALVADTNDETVTIGVPVEALSASVIGETEPSVDLEWTVNYPTLDATRVYRAEGHDEPFPDAFDEVLTLGGGVETAVDETVAFDTRYGYRVVGIVGSAESDATDEAAVTVGERPAFEIRIIDTNTPVTAGDEVGVEVEIVNTGDFAAETTVGLSVTEQ